MRGSRFCEDVFLSGFAFIVRHCRALAGRSGTGCGARGPISQAAYSRPRGDLYFYLPYCEVWRATVSLVPGHRHAKDSESRHASKRQSCSIPVDSVRTMAARAKLTHTWAESAPHCTASFLRV